MIQKNPKINLRDLGCARENKITTDFWMGVECNQMNQEQFSKVSQSIRPKKFAEKIHDKVGIEWLKEKVNFNGVREWL